jgi:hypothetical protein
VGIGASGAGGIGVELGRSMGVHIGAGILTSRAGLAGSIL